MRSWGKVLEQKQQLAVRRIEGGSSRCTFKVVEVKTLKAQK